MLTGKGWVNDTRACVIRRVAPRKFAPALKIEFSDCNNPNNRNAMITDRTVRMVRVFLRNRLATTKPVLVMFVCSGRVRRLRRTLLEQLALLQVLGTAGEFRCFRIVRHHYDRL